MPFGHMNAFFRHFLDSSLTPFYFVSIAYVTYLHTTYTCVHITYALLSSVSHLLSPSCLSIPSVSRERFVRYFFVVFVTVRLFVYINSSNKIRCGFGLFVSFGVFLGMVYLLLLFRVHSFLTFVCIGFTMLGRKEKSKRSLSF